MNAYVDGSPKSHVVAQLAIALNNPFHDCQARVNFVVYFPFTQVADYLAEVIASVAELSEFPVNDEELVCPI